ncbi:major capsid protein [Sigmofec virus UA08Rod_6044]|uniref:Major capsid protein n=1 Tax=Sigmofec virus UA08Rod_6044 TaxID=2929448 RepID=A0A976N1V2_9VIRU|nr:major capsid protein [Sigmofec virus UA08Rod_6044]
MTNILMRNKANNITSRVPQVKLPRSIFPIQKWRKQTMKAGYLYPIFCEEVLPSDTWILNTQNFIRLNTQVVPPIDNLQVKTYFFFVPSRLVWDNFAKQHGERKNPNDTIDYITPSITYPNGIPVGSIADYMGKTRTGIANNKINALPLRAYNLIWNEYFRAELIQDSLTVNTGDADDSPNIYNLAKKAKMHDYFTDCLPTLQLGEQVNIPLGTTAPVVGNGNAIGLVQINKDPNNNSILPLIGTTIFEGGTPTTTSGVLAHGTAQIGPVKINTSMSVANGDGSGNTNTGIALGLSPNSKASGLTADLSAAVSATISAMRLAIDTQEILERDNRNGVRYTEQLAGRYGALNPDLRLQRPQYLGGTVQPLFTTPVVQTSSTNTTTPQGNLAGYGVTGDSSKNTIKASFGEFGYIIGLACVQAVPQYQQGQGKMWDRWERYDYYYPEFNGLSDQAVKNKEIFLTGNEETDNATFGYIGRYDEYRYFNNEICGELRSDYEKSLDSWHYAEKFENTPTLSSEFIEDDTDEILKRSLVVQNNSDGTTAEQMIAEFNYNGGVARVMPSKATPQTGGRIL